MQPYARLLMIGGLVGSLACARSTADEDVSTRRDTTTVTDTAAVMDDTAGVSEQNPPGYRGMERDTSVFPYDTTDRGGEQDTLNRGYEVEQDTLFQDTTYQDTMFQDTTYQDTMFQDTTFQDTTYQPYPPDVEQDTSYQGVEQDTTWNTPDTSGYDWSDTTDPQ